MTNKVANIPQGATALLLKERVYEAQRNGTYAAHVVLDISRALSLQQLLRYIAPDIKCIVLDGWDCLPFDRISPSVEAQNTRAEAITALTKLEQQSANGVVKPCVVLITVTGFALKIAPATAENTNQLVLAKTHPIPQQQLVNKLAEIGFERTDIVRVVGEFAVRGGLIDVFPAGALHPVRVDFFGDDIESLSSFDVDTQLTLAPLESVAIQPVHSVDLSGKRIETFRKNYRALFGVGSGDPLYEAISEGRLYAGFEHWLPLFFDAPFQTPAALLTRAQFSFEDESQTALAEYLDQAADLYAARQSFLDKAQKGQTPYKPLPLNLLYITKSEAEITQQNAVVYAPYGVAESAQKPYTAARDFAPERANPNNNLLLEVATHLKNLVAADKRVLVACQSQGSRDRLNVMLQQHGVFDTAVVDSVETYSRLKPKQIGLLLLPYQQGFESPALAVISETDIFGTAYGRLRKKIHKADQFLREVSSLDAGDLVVHVDHGIGRFLGLETIEAAGARHDCLALEYAGGDKLFVPVENITVLSRYGNDDALIELDKLGGVSWQNRKARVKRNLLEMAGKLLEIASARALQKAPVFLATGEAYQQFCSRFPYAETNDQLTAIADIARDLASSKPMDRLICGDVGFGKTEVALRAAALVALQEVQVAVIAPTTLLARQHFETFSKRFAGFPVSIVQLSRFVPAKHMAENKKNAANGAARIIIGTHALLAESTKFHDLGLVIVDEEQHFGVKQKEKLKDLRKNVHVLTLTATPIPRTLQLSLSGVRDMTLITTPPLDRLAVNTHVMPFDPLIVREALLREHHRGGQSFIVCPHIADLDEAEKLLHELVPEVKLISAHGQLSPSELEDRMTAFYERRFEVLLATNIIESGLDVPTANTLVVLRADRFGLAQLHQIRGRVGRSKLRAHAYITWDAATPLTESGKKRLHVLSTLEGLGAGFQLASHDLDIRGGGNLLGDQQHGHIREVGIELYQAMLEDAVAEARMGAQSTPETQQNISFVPNLTLGVSVVIPEDYVADLSVRLSLYRRLADTQTDLEVDALGAEMVDRFGPLPNDVETLLKLMKIRMLCVKARVVAMDIGPKGALVSFLNNEPNDVPKLMTYLQKNAGLVKVRPDQKLFYPRVLNQPDQRLSAAYSIANQLAGL